MKIADTRLKKIFLIIISSCIVFVAVVILLISPIAKYLIEKYDEKYLGRQVELGWVYVNPFTGYIHITNLRVYESSNPNAIKDSDSLFFSAKGVSASFSLHKLISKIVEITKLTLDQPKGIIIQNGKDLNFEDLIKKFTPAKTDSTPSKYRFNLLYVKIINGEFHYHEKVIPILYFIKEVNFESSGLRWNVDTVTVKFSFLAGTGTGSIKGNFTINLKNKDYRVAAIVHKYDLTIIEQYLKELINYGQFSAYLEADIIATGNLSDQENLNAKGLIELDDFHFGKTIHDDYASFEKLVLKIDALSPRNHLYLFNSVMISRPYFKYERYDYLDNLEMMFGKNGVNISATKANPARFNLILKIADYIKVLSKNFFRSDYKINKLEIYNGNLKFNDYSLAEKFSISVNPFNVVADSIDKNHKRVKVSLKSGVLPYGNIFVTLSINPRDSGDFDLNYHFQGLPASMFNPYLISYTSFPLDRGTIEFNGIWNVRNGNIESVNHLLLIDPRISKRIRNKDAKWIPLPLIMAFIRERGNVIDYEIPITGNLNNPNFHLHDVILDLLGNIFVKPATTPYRMQVKNIENDIEKSLTLKWNIRQNALLPDQEKFVRRMAAFLNHNPEASIAVYPMHYEEREKEYIQFFEAKKKYFLLSKGKNIVSLNEEDSLYVEKMSVKDSLFVRYMIKQINDPMVFTIQEKCDRFVGPAIINSKFKQLNTARRDDFMSYFKTKSVQTHVKMYAAENSVPYNGYSFYKIIYKGEFPRSLLMAYHQMNELNNEAPRKWFREEREKNKSMLLK
jgi:hypothetical protein